MTSAKRTYMKPNGEHSDMKQLMCNSKNHTQILNAWEFPDVKHFLNLKLI